MELRPLRAGERPLVLVPLDEFFAGMPDLQHDTRLPVPAVLLALQEIIEEAPLQRHPPIGVERRPMRAAVHLEPFLTGGGSREPLEVAAGV